MIFQERAAPPEWAPFVTRLWYLETPRVRRYEKILPLPFVHLIVNLSEPYRLVDPRGQASVVEDAFVSGIQTEYLLIESPRLIRHVGVEFTPQGLRAFSTIAPSDATGRVQPASAALSGIAQLTRRLRRQPTPDAALASLEAFLHERRRPELQADTLVTEVLAAMADHPDERIGEFAVRAGITHKTVIAHFRAACGITPKAFAEVLRFHRFVTGLPIGEHLPGWADLAATSWYYDQPHVVRAFRRFSGYTPAEYVRRVTEFGPDAASFVPLDEVPQSPS
ncbi:helix-turn-helix domain-containing protein [Agromyces ramosus]|uniref:AraC-like DNA-binding protein n=1 Tax=Agromyces ramosus TaxID=33879 RepID=A0ABU0R3Y6_9MICO|nr:helix-turn-helix domain-containing protein [Agromyces ramosus]MDQ0892786.1 AraC-like DNA-binding protein [Agromyces ramosus]